MVPHELEQLTRSVIALYPAEAQPHLLAELDRYIYQASLVISPGKILVDIGSGVAPYPIVAQRLGMSVAMIDDYGDPEHLGPAEGLLGIHRKEGIQVVRGDVLTLELPFADSSVDVVCSFSSLDHWHHSPKHLYEQIRRILRPGGMLVLGAPNAVNLLKRFKVLAGRSNNVDWNWMYFDGTPWRGHIREPVMSELIDVCRWNDFRVVRTAGRNFVGSRIGFLNGVFGRGLMRFLELFPTLCREIYVIAEKQK